MASEMADRITGDPAVMVGKAVIAGTRMPVEPVLAKLAANPNVDEFFLDYPDLTVHDVKPCLHYASVVVSRTEYADDGEVRMKPGGTAQEPQGSPWLRELYDYIAPVRQEILDRGISEEEVNADIDAAIAEVRAERRTKRFASSILGSVVHRPRRASLSTERSSSARRG